MAKFKLNALLIYDPFSPIKMSKDNVEKGQGKGQKWFVL